MNNPIRLIDAGSVPFVRSQTAYHAVAYAMTPDSPDTIIFVSPKDPYVCVGFHQSLEKEVDLDYCAAAGIPVVRREVGGGAVYLDENQLFVQWIFKPDSLPWDIEKRFELYIRPIVETYKTLGIDACFRPVNDIQVRSRKIGGTGAAAIGNAEVVVGNFLFDFDFETMSRVLRVPDEKFRDKIFKSLSEYMTTVRQELGFIPDWKDVKQKYLERCSKILNSPIEFGTFTQDEITLMDQLDEKFRSDKWLNRKGGLVRPAIKINADVWVGESTHKAPGGLIRINMRTHGDRIDDLSISGDFTFHPHEKLAEFEKSLIGVSITESELGTAISDFYNQHGLQSPGVDKIDWIRAISALTEAGLEG